MDFVEYAKECSQQEYCTNCPIRENCPVRLSFYRSDEEFSEDIGLTNYLALKISAETDLKSSIAAVLFRSEMLKKRKREMELYPLYSVQ